MFGAAFGVAPVRHARLRVAPVGEVRRRGSAADRGGLPGSRRGLAID
jgi:hypothetical protein